MKNQLTKKLPLISVIIACRNEEKQLGLCLNSLLAQDYPQNKLEILVIDGQSQDRTKKIIKNYQRQYPFIKLLDNPQKITAAAFNLGIKNAQGKLIALVGAHSTLKNDYLAKCVFYLKKYQADNVGGLMKTLPHDKTIIAQALALAWVHPLATGNSVFKIGNPKPKWVDTVFGGCYRKEIIQKIGLFDERFVRSQDLEFNLRLKKAGGKILFVPEIISYYYPRAKLRDFIKHSWQDGLWITYPLKFKTLFCLRHYTPLFFVVALGLITLLSFLAPLFLYLLLCLVFLYGLAIVYSAIEISLKAKQAKLLFLMPLIFISRHLSYGFGSLWGLLKLLVK